MRGKRRKWDENVWETVKSEETGRNRKEPKMGRNDENSRKTEKRPERDLELFQKSPYSCMRLRSEWNTEWRNLKARFDWENREGRNFDAFWRFFGPYYKDFWEIRKMAKMGEIG